MKKTEIFSGVGTARITPFSSGVIDFRTLGGLIEGQIKAGIDAIIIGGTTGEAATLSDDERYRLFSFAAAQIRHRVPLIFGTGTNDTKAAIRHTMLASSIGCDGVLVVTPYYNKGTESGIIKHFEAVADASSVPVLLYNVPSRTGVNLSIDAVRALSTHERIVGIKEAHDSAERLVELSEMRESLTLYAGNDSAFYEVLALGGGGVISVVSNAYPERVKRIYELYKSGDSRGALREQIALLPIIKAAFIETNPSPIKYIMNRLGLCQNELRLPLYPVTESSAHVIERALERKSEAE